MTTRIRSKALATAALGIALSLLLAAPTTAIPAWSNTERALLLDTPAAPSNCKTRTDQVPNLFFPHGKVTLYSVSWIDNSSNENGFTVEEWWRNQSGAWVLKWSQNTAANSTRLRVDGKWPNFNFRVKAFNASGDSSWSNWAH